jgi:Cd2+/Zn2+-exporting ATPase
MPGNEEEEHCPVCLDLEDLEKEEEPIWREREVRYISASFLLLIAGLYLEFVRGEMLPATLLFLAVAALSGHQIIREGLTALLKLRFSIDLLMTIAAAGAFMIGHGEEGATVLFLFSIAEFLEEHAADRARSSIRELMRIAPETARIKRDGEEVEVHVHEVGPGDVVVVRPGEKIPLDGVVVEGVSMVNQAPITGESIPVVKEVGSEVYAGTLNEDGYLEVRVTKKPDQTVLSKIVAMVAEAQKRRSETEKFIDRFSSYYTPGVILLAVLVATVPPAMGYPFQEWLYRALVLLVVSCPCALAISTPVSMVSGIASAARNGVLIKGSSYLEDMGRITTLAFDKTGTLTTGRPRVIEVEAVDRRRRREILRIAASLEAKSGHPIARAVVEEAGRQGLKLLEIRDFRDIPGKGVIGIVDGRTFHVGSRRLFEEKGIRFPREKVAQMEEEGKTVVLVGDGRESFGVIAVMDEVREEAAETIGFFKERGVRVVMLTGDNEGTARAIARLTGVDEYHHSLLPEDKVRIIEELTEKYGRVAMVGDGVNDAPALARATVGIAMGAIGSDVALETADIALMEDDLSRLNYLFELSKRTLRVVKQNVAASITVKGSLAALALPGIATLWLAVGVGDMGLSLAVILNAMRLSLVKR